MVVSRLGRHLDERGPGLSWQSIRTEGRGDCKLTLAFDALASYQAPRSP